MGPPNGDLFLGFQIKKDIAKLNSNQAEYNPKTKSDAGITCLDLGIQKPFLPVSL